MTNPIEEATVARIAADPELAALTRARSRLGLAVVGAMVVVYFGYILLLAFAPTLMRSHVTAHITASFPLGFAVLVITFALVAFHVARSASHIDPVRERIVARSRT